MAVFWQQNDIKLKIRKEKLSSLERFLKIGRLRIKAMASSTAAALFFRKFVEAIPLL